MFIPRRKHNRVISKHHQSTFCRKRIALNDLSLTSRDIQMAIYCKKPTESSTKNTKPTKVIRQYIISSSASNFQSNNICHLKPLTTVAYWHSNIPLQEHSPKPSLYYTASTHYSWIPKSRVIITKHTTMYMASSDFPTYTLTQN